MDTERKDGVAQSLPDSDWRSTWRWGFFLEEVMCRFRTEWREYVAQSKSNSYKYCVFFVYSVNIDQSPSKEQALQ